MKQICTILVCSLFVHCLSPAAGQTNESGLDLPSSFFPILDWDLQYYGWENKNNVRQNGLENLSDCGFTIAGFVHTRDVEKLKELGLKALAFGDNDSITFGQWNNLWRDTAITGEIIDEKIRKMVKRTGNSEAIIGYYICDEPGASMFPRLAKAVECVHKYAPGKLAYINLFPVYATSGAKGISQLETETYQEHLDRYMTEVKPEMLSYDNYMVQYSMDLEEESHASLYYRNLLDIRETAITYGVPFWNIVSSNRIEQTSAIPSPANLLFQAYTTLAAGGRGVSWYTYYTRAYGYAPIDQEGNKTQTWYYLKEVNRQLGVLGPIMNRMTTTGVYFTSPTPVSDLPPLPGMLVEQIEADSPVMVGEFKGNDGRDYVMVVNLSLEKSTGFKITLQDEGSAIQVISSADGRLNEYTAEEGHWLVAGQGVLLKLSKN